MFYYSFYLVHTICDINYTLGHDGQWLTSKSKPVDFSDFPNFDQNIGEPGTSILWVIKAFGSPVLFTIPSDISSTIKFMFYPICSAAAIVKGKHLVIIQTLRDDIYLVT